MGAKYVKSRSRELTKFVPSPLSLSFIPFMVKRFDVPGIPKLEKLPLPPSVFITTPGAVCAIYVRSLPGFGTSPICFWFIVVEKSPFWA